MVILLDPADTLAKEGQVGGDRCCPVPRTHLLTLTPLTHATSNTLPDCCIKLSIPRSNPLPQAINRVIRLGQTRPVQVYRVFMRHTVEERLLAYRSTKGQLDVKPGEENDVDGSDAAKHGGSHTLAAAGNFAEGSAEGGGGGGQPVSMERFRVLLGAKECILD